MKTDEYEPQHYFIYILYCSMSCEFYYCQWFFQFVRSVVCEYFFFVFFFSLLFGQFRPILWIERTIHHKCIIFINNIQHQHREKRNEWNEMKIFFQFIFSVIRSSCSKKKKVIRINSHCFYLFLYLLLLFLVRK